MLDALVAEARLRWGLDPGAGLQVFAAETLDGAPIEPSRPLLIVPLATLRAESAAVDARPLTGRAGPSGRDPLALLARLYPADHPVGQFGAAYVAATHHVNARCGLFTHVLYEPDAFFERVERDGARLLPPRGTGLGFDDLLERLPWTSIG